MTFISVVHYIKDMIIAAMVVDNEEAVGNHEAYQVFKVVTNLGMEFVRILGVA